MRDIRGSAEFSADGTMRHRLDRWWSDEPRALIGMANPSDAGAERNDPTIHSIIRLTRSLPGIGGFTAVNWRPRIATYPKDLHRWLASVDLHELADIDEANLELIRNLSADAGIRLAAWGDVVPLTPHTSAYKHALALNHTEALWCFGTTKSGAPKHPLARGKSRIPNGTLPSIWLPGVTTVEILPPVEMGAQERSDGAST